MTASSRLPDDEFDFAPSSTKPPPIPPTWQAWYELLDIAPELRKLHRQGVNQTPPPRCMSDLVFLGLCAAFADKRKRSILRALILDLLSEDLMDLLLEPEKEA